MIVIRRFAVASAFARLIERQCGSAPATEGHFGSQSGGSCYVHVAPEECALILMAADLDPLMEERAVVPRAHAEALLEVCSVRAAYARARVALDDGREAFIERFTHPGKLDLIAVEFQAREEADQFLVPSWFGPEVSADTNFSRLSVAMGCPAPLEIGLSNLVLEGVLDLLDQMRDRSPAVSEAAGPSPPDPVAAEAPDVPQNSAAEGVIAHLSQDLEAQAMVQSPAANGARPRGPGTARAHSAFAWQRITGASHDARTDR
jgi:CYTH domain-containing protein